MRMMKLAGAILAAVLAAATTVSAQDAAANYPSKPIKIVIPFGAGGGNELFAQTVVIENKPGAGGRIAADYVLNQPHDGYTLFVGASGVMSVASAIYPCLLYTS